MAARCWHQAEVVLINLPTDNPTIQTVRMSIAAQPAVKMPYLLAVFRLPKLISNSFCSIFFG
jgi:hypothetical protein